MKVKWDANICIHAGECVKNLPNVFKIVNEEFVIDESSASEDDVRRVVGLCPSGALKIED